MVENLTRAQTLGELMRLLLYRSRHSQEELAEKAGASTGTVSNYLNNTAGRRDAETLRRIAGIFAGWLEVEVDDVWNALGAYLDGKREKAPDKSPGPGRTMV